jgi:hypothetical protein
MVNGTIRAMARTPNSGYLIFTANNVGGTQITGGLTGTPNYTGSNVVVRDAQWILDRSLITSQSGGVINFWPPLTYNIPLSLGANGYFIQNTNSDLDQVGEWTYDSTNKIIKVYATSTPTVQISTIDTLVWVYKKNYLTFTNLSISGANKSAMQLDTTLRITIKNCYLNNNGKYGICGVAAIGTTLKIDSIQNTLSDHILMKATNFATNQAASTCDSLLIDSCYLNFGGQLAGMGGAGNGEYMSIWAIGKNDTITNNVIKNSGYEGCYWIGQKNFIAYNFIDTFCNVKDDGGGIVTFAATASFPQNYDSGSVVRHNISGDGIGAPAGITVPPVGIGYYLDDNTRYVTVDSNTAFNCIFADFYTFGENDHLNIYDNTWDDSVGNAGFMGEQISSTTNSNIKRNIYYSRNSSNFSFYINVTNTSMGVDSNYYLRPLDETTSLKMASTTYNLASWQIATGYDTHGHITPSPITSNIGTLFYNATHTPKNILLSGKQFDAMGVVYVGQAIVPPFGSLLLFPTTTLPFIYNFRHNHVR